MCPSDLEEEVRDIHTPTPCQVRSYHFSSFFIEHSEGQNSDSEAEDKTGQSSNCNRNEIQLPPLVINSPADLIKLVPRRPFPERDNLTEDSFESSASENEAPSQASNFTNENEEDQPIEDLTETDAMSAELLRQLQEQIAAIQAQQKKTSTALETAPIPESTGTHRPPVFHGYDSEDVSRWLNKFESYLKLRRINPASPTALAELELNLAGPAEDFYYSLPADQRETFNQLRDALRERFANDNQSWITWQAVSTRQQGPLEPLDVYLTDLTNKFRRLNISDADKMRYFIQGLRSDVRETVLLKQPRTFREAQEMARLACAVKTTMSDFPQDSLSTQVTNLTQTMNSLLLPSVSKAKQGFPSEDKQLMAMMEQNNTILAELSASISQLRNPTSESKVRFNVSQNDTNQSSVAALARPHEKSDIQELKELLLDKIQSLDRHFDARIRGLARRNEGQREEIPRQRTREGQRRCFTCGQTGHFAINCPERRDPSPEPFPQESYPARRSNYQPYSSCNQQRHDYRNLPQQNRRELNLAALDEHLANEGFVAELERNTSNRVFTDSQEPLHKKGTIMQNTSVNISSEAVMFYKQKSRKSENLHRRLTPRCPPPFSGRGKQTFQDVKPPAKLETQPHLGHVPEPARTPENNVENIQEEIKSYLSSALELFGRLPSRPITTGHPGTQSYQAESSRVVVSQGTTPQSSCLPIKSPTVVEAKAAENAPRKQYLAFSQASQLIPANSPKCESEDSVHNRDKLLSFTAKHFEEFPSDVTQSLFPDPSKFTRNGQDSSPQPVQNVIDVLNENASKQYPSLEEHRTYVLPSHV